MIIVTKKRERKKERVREGEMYVNGEKGRREQNTPWAVKKNKSENTGHNDNININNNDK